MLFSLCSRQTTSKIKERKVLCALTWNRFGQDNEHCGEDSKDRSADDDRVVAATGDLLEVEDRPENGERAGTDRHQGKGDRLTQDTVGDEETSLGNAPHDARDDPRENALYMKIRTIAFVDQIDDVVEYRREEDARVHGIDVVQTVLRC